VLTATAHFVPPESVQGGDWRTVCRRDVQDLPDGHTYTLHAHETTCEECKRGLVFLP